MLGGIGRTTLYKLVEQGDPANVKIGSRSFITADGFVAEPHRSPGSTFKSRRSVYDYTAALRFASL